MICRRCNHTFPHDFDTCPNCGRRHGGTPTERYFKLAAILPGLLALALAVYLFNASQ